MIYIYIPVRASTPSLLWETWNWRRERRNQLWGRYTPSPAAWTSTSPSCSGTRSIPDAAAARDLSPAAPSSAAPASSPPRTFPPATLSARRWISSCCSSSSSFSPHETTTNPPLLLFACWIPHPSPSSCSFLSWSELFHRQSSVKPLFLYMHINIFFFLSFFLSTWVFGV